MPNTAHALTNFTPLPSDPRLLTAEHMRLVFADAETNRRVAARLATQVQPSTSAQPSGESQVKSA